MGTTDGRHARRERTRVAVIDAVFSLVRDGKVPPTSEAVAERAGVSVSTMFRNFDGLHDIQQQAFDRFQERYAHLLTALPDPSADLDERITHFVETRLELYAEAGALMLLARQRAVDYQPMAEAVGRMRSRLADQTRSWFEPECAKQTPAGAADAIALVDAMTSPESFDVMSGFHARSSEQIADAWRSGIDALFASDTSSSTTKPSDEGVAP